jgi:hypothetical protein
MGPSHPCFRLNVQFVMTHILKFEVDPLTPTHHNSYTSARSPWNDLMGKSVLGRIEDSEMSLLILPRIQQVAQTLTSLVSRC